ncbi:hypothetical protein [Aurantivibrio plasticivorans]
MIPLIHHPSPQGLLHKELATFAQTTLEQKIVAVRYDWSPNYLKRGETEVLVAVFCLVRQGEQVRIGLGVFADHHGVQELTSLTETSSALISWLAERQTPFFWLDQPIELQPIHIPKPWGQEIWFTGIEERGQSRVTDGRYSIPLPWLLSACGECCLAKQSNNGKTFDATPILLKTLDPLPEPVFGDLYFELHEEKREVYVVTHIDQQAWPGGEGGIRFGFSVEKRDEFPDDTHFKKAYLASVKKYRVIREQIDELVDGFRVEEGIGVNEPVSANQSKQWLAKLPAELLREEQALREDMESFIHVQSLQLGDVVKVPTLTPHSLMHGVRTIEFQTPVYERKILSFAQKVLTQSHWDTDAAMQLADLSPATIPDLALIHEKDGCSIESVVEFQDFSVERICLQPSATFSLPLDHSYRLLITVSSGICIDGSQRPSEQAELLPAGTGPLLISNTSASEAVFLLAKPH